MAQATALVCSACGYQTLQWMGRCPDCRAWDTFQKAPRSGRSPVSNGQTVLAQPLSSFEGRQPPRIATGIAELDRVLGGGLVGGSVILLSGEPGVGKSTLMLQAAGSLESTSHKVLLVCGEESPEQVAQRAQRIDGSPASGSLIVSETDVNEIRLLMHDVDVVVIDSIQTMRSPEIASEPGSVSQVKVCAAAIAQSARSSGTPVILIGHITKEGTVAGPRSLEHLVDAVLTFEGDRSSSLRMIRASKNRFGSTGEIGVFEMAEAGLVEVPDASKLFLADRIKGAAGSAVGSILEGRRALAVEIQALTGGETARRVANGLDVSRLMVISAVLERCAEVRLQRADVYASLAGGVRTSDPGADLPLALAIASSYYQLGLPPDLLAIGELGLTGELRRVPGMETRIAEAERLGFGKVVVPNSFNGRTSVELLRFEDITKVVNSLLNS